MVTDIPADRTGLAAAPKGAVAGGVVGESLSGPGTYVGPCAAGRDYVYTLYALDKVLNGQSGTTRSEAEQGIGGHILGRSSLTAHAPK